MEIDLRTITTLDEAGPNLELLEARAREALDGLEGPAIPDGFLERHLSGALGTPESLLLVAESEPGTANLGLCLVGPHTDPLSGLRTPMILVLAVDPGVRHRALAGTLVKEARRQMSMRGFAALAARCAHGDDALISMGERWGFVRRWEYFEH